MATTPAAPSVPPAVQVDGLVAEYDGRAVLDHVSMQARQGEITVVLGESGCGKTTLLRHIVGLLTPKTGRVCINGQDFQAASEEERSGSCVTSACRFRVEPCSAL